MPIRSDWKLQREGSPPSQSPERNLLNTLFRYHDRYYQSPYQKDAPQSRAYPPAHPPRAIHATDHERAFHNLKALLWLGSASHINCFLDSAVANNWVNDTYDWAKEIVVVTGGNDGIGVIVVKLLAERGIKVAVLDVQPLTYEGEFEFNISKLYTCICTYILYV